MRILGYCAVNQDRRFPEAEARILALEGVAQLVFDYADDSALPWYENVLNKYRTARGMTLAGGFDALLTCESDMLIPPDAAIRLSKAAEQHGAGVAYGVYVLRHGVPYWNICVALEEEVGFFLTDKIVRHNAPVEWAATLAGTPFQCYGSGFGCTLIRREVLEQLGFRNFGDAESFYVDWLFAADCNARKIKQVCDPRVACGHITDEKTVLYPDLGQEKLVRSEALTGRISV